MRGKVSKRLRKLVATHNVDLFNLIFQIYKGKVAEFNYKTMNKAVKKIWPEYKERIQKMKITKLTVEKEKVNEVNTLGTEQG